MNPIEPDMGLLPNEYPRDFLAQYDPLECLANGHQTETLLVQSKADGQLYVAKCSEASAAAPEGSILSRLQHEGLPAYADAFENDAMRITVRAHVPGLPLDRYAQEHPLSIAEAVDFCVQLCEILAYIHGQNPPVIHRDIKPQNIIIRPDGRLVLIDFDIARLHSDDAQTDTVIFGTRTYAPPEQYGFGQTDCRADLYALGVLLRFLLTGGDEERPIAKPLMRIIDRCTAFAPKDRYASAKAVRKALLKTQRPTVSRRRAAALCALIALVLAGIGFAVGRYTPFLSPKGAADAYAFREPLIEAAVRAQLRLEPDEPIAPEALADIRALYIFGTETAIKPDVFDAGLGGDGAERFRRGSIQSLDDLLMMPGLIRLQVSFQALADISALANCPLLRDVNLAHTQVSDVSVLAGLPDLQALTLYDTAVTDLSCLNSCPALEVLDLGNTTLRMETLGGFDTVTHLHLNYAQLDTLDGLERYARLRVLHLADAQIPLPDTLSLPPTLREIYADGALHERLSKLCAGTPVTVLVE
ncbi:MAG: protein kinase [Oscillospiraceae bacterium]|jgi:hypothetical protein|nr:protein kinase [Oscillospiraceae bacterium]